MTTITPYNQNAVTVTGTGGTALLPTKPPVTPAPVPSPFVGLTGGDIAKAEKTTPAVITSTAADTDLNNIRTNLQNIQTGMTTQARNVAQSKADDEAYRIAYQKIEQDRAASDAKIAADKAKAGIISGETTATEPVTKTKKTTQTQVEAPQTDADRINEEAYNKALETSKTIDDIRKGTIPLSAGEQAQVDNLKNQFNRLIESTKTANQNYQSGLEILGAQSGRQRYTPVTHLGTINDAIVKGTQKIADLNVEMASAVAQMEQGFRDNNIKAVQAANTAYQEAAASRVKYLTDLSDKAAAAVKAQQDAITKAKDTLNKSLEDLAATAKTNGAPQDVIDGILTSQNVADAYYAAGNYSAGGTGIIGEYNRYVADATARGQQPLSFTSYQDQDANRKIRIQNAGNAAGLTTAMINTALKLSDDYEARSKDFYSARDAYNRVLASATDPSAAGDLSLIYNYMKTLDPNSTVREGEFATAANAGSAWQQVGAKYNKIVSGERLTDTQRKDFVDRATKLFNSAVAQQESTVNEFTKRAEQYGVPANLVVRGTNATGSEDAIHNEQEATAQLTSYQKNHPEKAAEIESNIETFEQSLGRPATAQEFLQAFPEYKE